MENHLKKMPSPLLSLVPILVLVALLFVTIRTFGSDALSGGSQVVLLTTTAVASLLAMIFCKVKWRDIEEAICKNIFGVATAIIILGNYIPVYTSLSIIITNSHKLIGIEFVRNKERR